MNNTSSSVSMAPPPPLAATVDEKKAEKKSDKKTKRKYLVPLTEEDFIKAYNDPSLTSTKTRKLMLELIDVLNQYNDVK